MCCRPFFAIKNLLPAFKNGFAESLADGFLDGFWVRKTDFNG